MEIKEIYYINLNLRDRLDIEFTAAKKTIYRIWRISLVFGSGIVTEVRK